MAAGQRLRFRVRVLVKVAKRRDGWPAEVEEAVTTYNDYVLLALLPAAARAIVQ